MKPIWTLVRAAVISAAVCSISALPVEAIAVSSIINPVRMTPTGASSSESGIARTSDGITPPEAAAAQAQRIFSAAKLKNEPYRPLTAVKSGKDVPASPDPLVAYRWKETSADDDLQIYILKPCTMSSDRPEAFSVRRQVPDVDVTVSSPCDLMFDFGRVSAGWLEFECDDLGDLAGGMDGLAAGTPASTTPYPAPADGTADPAANPSPAAPSPAVGLECSISEFNEPAVFNAGSQHPRKTLAPTRYGKVFRLELNKELYEGVRYAWIHVRSIDKPLRIKNVRLVCQARPANYDGSFDSNDPTLNRIWYTAAYTVRLNFLKDYFGAILMERSDRFSWTGDAHTSQAAALVAFGNYEFVRKNLLHTADQSNGILSYPLYWVQSLVDYYEYTGDGELLGQLCDNACAKLDDAFEHFDDARSPAFYGWDERLGAGFENPGCPESRMALKMLAIQTMRRFAGAMSASGREDLARKYSTMADSKAKPYNDCPGIFNEYDIFAVSDAVNAGAIPPQSWDEVWQRTYSDRLHRLSYSPFNEYFVLNAVARMGRHAEAMNTIDDCWGGQLRYGATTFFEVFRPSWNLCSLGENDAPVNNQCGYTSLTHPWSAGVAKWLTEEVLGVKPQTPGFGTFSVTPHLTSGLTRVSGDVPTPHGSISFAIDVLEGTSSLVVPEGTCASVSIPLMGCADVKVTLDGKPLEPEACTPTHAQLPQIGPGSHSLVLEYADAITSPSATEAFEYAIPSSAVSEDSSTGGNWKGVYGSKGYCLFGYDGPGSDRVLLPAGCAGITCNKQTPCHWASDTSDPRALVSNRDSDNSRSLGAICTGDPAPCMQTMTIDVDYRSRSPYRLTLYFVDWDNSGRRSAVELFDLSTRRLLSPVHIVRDYSGGRYVTFEVDRPVRVRICQVRGVNAPVSALFLD
ncbi:MAG: alpha-L-rhamnosidase C-terminal domain-containing protein [Candidatus Cryptobacteroides sp.]